MRPSDYPEFQKCMAIISETYSKPASNAKLDIWWSVFANYEVGDFEKAIFKHVTDPNKGTFEPKPADIIRFMPEPKQVMRLEDKGGLSWCANTQALIDKYHPEMGSYFKTIITSTDNLKVEK
jgi:hypothetical protein